jgi:hypothetical protein
VILNPFFIFCRKNEKKEKKEKKRKKTSLKKNKFEKKQV